MNLRTQYSLRQALPVALFGLPLYGLEIGLGRVVGSYDLELVPSVLGSAALVWFPLIGALTFVLAFYRFESEIDRQALVRQTPLSTFHWVLNWALLSVFWLTLMVTAAGSSGPPSTQEGWARLGITGLGLFFGLCLLKWIYLDWVQKLDQGGGSDADPMGVPAPTSPALTPGGKSAHNACRVWS